MEEKYATHLYEFSSVIRLYITVNNREVTICQSLITIDGWMRNIIHSRKPKMQIVDKAALLPSGWAGLASFLK